MTSSRLPGKVLMDVNGEPMLVRQWDRLKLSTKADLLVLATSVESSDEPLVEVCRQKGIAYHRGSLDDVLDRYYQAARRYKLDVIVRLTADCPLIDPAILDQMADLFLRGEFDYLANTAPPEGSTFPDGMDVEIFSMQALERAWRESRKPSEREHVTFFFWKNPNLFRTHRYDLGKSHSRYRLTVDYPEDLEVIRAIYGALGAQPAFNFESIISFLDSHPEIRNRNANILPNQGWQSAFDKDAKLENRPS